MRLACEVTMHSRHTPLIFGTPFAILLGSAVAVGAPAPVAAPLHPESRLPPSARPTLASPARIGVRLEAPVWNAEGLWPAAPSHFPALASTEHKGTPIHDPSAGAWFASANGTIVRIDGDHLRVVADNVQGRDIDVRVSASVAVSREPDDTIVLHRFGARKERKVLLAGSGFFHPRFSPDGSSLIVSESRSAGGHLWLVPLDGAPVDLGEGYDPAWHPDGRRVVFVRLTHDGLSVTASDLWVRDIASRTESRLAQTSATAEVKPAISPDGRWIAFADARTGDGWFASLSLTGGR